MSEDLLREQCLFWEQKAENALRAAEYANRQLALHVGRLALLLEPDTTNVLYLDEYKRNAPPDVS